MAGSARLWSQRWLWTAAVGVVAAVFWIAALGVGLRGWLTLGPRPGLVGHVTEFGERAAPYMITASVLTLTTALMGVGTALVRHLVDGPAAEAVGGEVGKSGNDEAAAPADEERRGG